HDQDTDVAAQRDTLKNALQRIVLPVNHTRSPPYYHGDIKSAAELEAALQLTLDRLRIDIATKATVFRALEALEFAARPGISSAPTGTQGAPCWARSSPSIPTRAAPAARWRWPTSRGFSPRPAIACSWSTGISKRPACTGIFIRSCATRSS